MNKGVVNLNKQEYQINKFLKKKERAKERRKKAREVYTKSVKALTERRDNVDLDALKGVPTDVIEVAMYSAKLERIKVEEELLTDYIELCDFLEHLLQQQECCKVRNTRKISDDDIERIRELRERGYTYSEIVETTGWSKGTVSNVINNKY